MSVLFIEGVDGTPADVTDYNANWDLLEGSLDDIGEYIVSGLVQSAGTGLSVNVTSGVASIGGRVTKATSFTIGGLTPSTTNHLYLNQDGTGTANTSGTQPALSVKLGTATTDGSGVTAVGTNWAAGRMTRRRTEALVAGGGAGHPRAVDLAQWHATNNEGNEVKGVLPAGAYAGLTPPLTLTLDDANQASVQTVLTLGHTYNAGGGAAGIGVALDLSVETSTNSTSKVAASLQATLTNLTPASATGQLLVRLIDNNVQVTPFTVASKDIRIPQVPANAAQHGLLNIGSGGFDGTAGHFAGDAPGTYLAMNAPSGYLGAYLDIQKNGVRLLYLDPNGALYRLSAPVGSANAGQLSLGDTVAAFDGASAGHFVGSANGTYLAINAASGFAGRLMDLQVAGVSKVLCGAGGVLTVANKVATNGLQVGQATKTANYTLLTTDTVIFGDATSGNITITLPTAANGTGQIYIVNKKDASGNTVTLAAAGVELINGANTSVLAAQYAVVRVISNGTQWYTI